LEDKKFYAGNTVPKTYTFTDSAGEAFDPDTITVLVKNPSGVTEETLDIGDLVRTATGVYLLRYNLPVDAEAGTWVFQVTATVTADNYVKTSEFSFSVSTQPYGSLAVVKYLCNIKLTDTSKDAVVLVFMEKATSFVNSALKPYVSTLPLSSVPDVVASVAEFYAAGLFLQKDQQDEKPHPYMAFAEEKLQSYVETEYVKNQHVAGKVRVTLYSEIDE
jgi:hypothetical protein